MHSNGARCHPLGGTAKPWCFGSIRRGHAALHRSHSSYVGRRGTVGLFWWSACRKRTCSPHLVVAHLVAVKEAAEMIKKSSRTKIRGQLCLPTVEVHLGAVHDVHGGGYLQRGRRHAGSNQTGRGRLLLLLFDRFLCCTWGHVHGLWLLQRSAGSHGVVGPRGLHPRGHSRCCRRGVVR